ncbi:MAG: VWA domain-containing protein [Oscillospiraceae bacterium]|nr:VWA domain-containing protein [Oscillospiraceae bacterium]
MDNVDNKLLLNRWRLVLGKYSQTGLGFGEGDDGAGQGGSGGFMYQEIDDLMDFLYGREYGKDRGVMEGSLGDSVMVIPKWINKIHELFPKETVEKLENHALERYNLTELLTDQRVLEKLEPNINLLKQIISLKGVMNQQVLQTARKIIRQVVDELTKKLETQVKNAIMGRKDKNQSTIFKCSKNFDFRKTIRKNLKNYDADSEKIVVQKIYFNRNIKRFNPWHIIICVDESGSMTDSVIYSAVMAGIFSKLPVLSTKLVIFDTSIVDLSNYIDDPVETLMSMQLGGGTDIGKALTYCESLLTYPYRTIVVLVSDLCDGGGYQIMYNRARSIIESGAKLICLTALDNDCVGVYDKTAAKKLTVLGAKVAALTPAKLADWVAGVITN